MRFACFLGPSLLALNLEVSLQFRMLWNILLRTPILILFITYDTLIDVVISRLPAMSNNGDSLLTRLPAVAARRL